MTRKSFSLRGLTQTTLVAVTALNLVALIGCGSDMSMGPDLSAQDESGEVSLSGARAAKFATPTNFEALVVASNRVHLSWGIPSIGYTAIIKIDGVEIARVDARLGMLDDNFTRPVGSHIYSLAFAKGNSKSQEARATVNILANELPDGGRTDDRPEDGR